MVTWLQRLASVAVLVLFIFGLSRAATFRFQQQEDAFRKECQQKLQAAGMTPAAAKAKYPTPEIQLVSSGCVMAGATTDAMVSGKFSPGSRLFLENDNLELVKADLVGGQFRATVKAPAGIGPESAAFTVISPACQSARSQDRAITVGGKYEWTMDAGNGWKVVARPQATTPCPSGSQDIPYEVSFYRKGETTPFEKLTGKLSFSIYNTRNYAFTISPPSNAPAGAVDYQQLMQKFSDPNLTPAQREQLMKQIQQAAGQMQAQMQKMADPAYAKQQADLERQRQQEFGCDRIEAGLQNGAVTGEMRCSEKVGRRIPVTGAVAAGR